MTVSSELPDPSLCPLCGAANQCAVENGKSINTCWCATTPISRDALDAIPAELRNRACLCLQCATGTQTDTGTAAVSIWSKS